MRVIAGTLKGRRLEAPSWPGLRPTADKLRETLFNVLGARIQGARVADLGAGTGAVGIEALSRGAAEVLFLDADRRACRLIARNLARAGLRAGYTIVHSTVEDAPRRFGPSGFDIVFLDLPYDDPGLDRAIAAAARLVAPGGCLVVEHARRRDVPERAAALERVRIVRSGDSALSLFRRAAGEEG
jgi:16S rRNA (guanine966-N2)-methyltransferase